MTVTNHQQTTPFVDDTLRTTPEAQEFVDRLIAEVRKLRAEVNTLRAEVNTLRSDVDDHETRITALEP